MPFVYACNLDIGIKIGKTNDFEKRKAQFNTSNTNKIELIALLDLSSESDAFVYEKLIHELLKPYQIPKKEIFECDPQKIKETFTNVQHMLNYQAEIMTGTTCNQEIKALQKTKQELHDQIQISKLKKECSELTLKLPDQIKVCPDFENWLNEHIIYAKDNITTLKEIACNYLQQDKVSPRHLNVYKTQIQQWIKQQRYEIKSDFQDTTYNSVKYRGWRDLKLI